MKKYFVLIIITCLCTGCFHYQELNSMAIITTMGLTKEKGEYLLILKETIPKKEENKFAATYKYYRASAPTLKKALVEIEEHSSKDLYLKQIQNIIVTDPKYLKEVPKNFKKHIVLYQTNELEKVLKTNSNYQYLNNLAKEHTVTLRDYFKNQKKDIPTIKVYQNELLIKP